MNYNLIIISLVLILLFSTHCLTQQPEKLKNHSSESDSLTEETIQDSVLRRPPGPPTCPYEDSFSIPLDNVTMVKARGKIISDLNRYRFLIQSYPKAENSISTAYMNMAGMFDFQKNTIVEMSLKANLEERDQVIWLTVTCSVGEARMRDTKWSCEISGSIRDQIKVFLLNWQSDLISKAGEY